MALAFDLPQHLPRGGKTQDKSTHILTKVGQATTHSLNADLAASWLEELDSTIRDTKTRISNRIHNDLPAFERQLESSVSVQTRLGNLSTNVDRLAELLNEPKTGILPNLLHTLSAHGTLVEQANDADVAHRAVAHLFHTQEELNTLSDRVQNGELPASSQACVRVQNLIAEAPSPLGRAEVMGDIRKRYRTMNDRIQEQLGDTYGRSIVFSSSTDSISLKILPSTIVPPTSTRITLSDIFHSLHPDSLSSRLATFRRDLISRFVEPVLVSSRTLALESSESSSILTLSPSTSLPLHSLEVLITFLNSQIFPYLPPAHASFSSTFHAPITSAILTLLLKPSIPTSTPSIPSFLGIVDEAVRFEDLLLPTDARDKPISDWAHGVATHYEKKRREDVLQRAREVVGRPEDGATVTIEVAVQHLPAESNGEETGWDFDREHFGKAIADANGSQSHDGLHGDVHSERDHEEHNRDQETSDGWGWGDDDPDVDESSSPPYLEPPAVEEEDDPWGDDGWDAEPMPQPQPPKEPKMAKGLEKFSAKARGISTPNTPVASPVIATAPKPAPPQQQPAKPRAPHSQAKKKPDKETYHVSLRAKTILEIAQGLMQEGQELLESNVFAEHTSDGTALPGQLLAAAAASVLDLHRALYPVAHSAALASDVDLAMRWSNDCRYMSEEVVRIRNQGGPAFKKWTETDDQLKLLGETWFGDAIVQQQEAVQNMLVGARGFAEVAKPERFEECKSAIEQVLREITSTARQWKVTLTRRSYLDALGQVVDDALFRVMDDILALEDIPEADSERLSELCEVLAQLEELFVDVPGERSVVGSYVPLWFKFSYLSWLIKGSIADLSYLFDQGMLVDYEIDELIRLLRALFAETPLRENTIAKIARGHPVPVGGDSD